MKKVFLGSLAVLIALMMSCQMSGDTGTGEVVLNLSIDGIMARTAMPDGLELKPDYIYIEGIGPGGAKREAWISIPAGASGSVPLNLGQLLSGNWEFKLTAYEWDGNPQYDSLKPVGGIPIGEGQVAIMIRAGLMNPVEVMLNPYTGENDGVVVTYRMKLSLDWRAESEELRASLNDLKLEVSIFGQGGEFDNYDIANLRAPTEQELSDGLVVYDTIDVGMPGSYLINVVLKNGTTRIARRIETAFVTGNVLTRQILRLYINPGSTGFELLDAIPSPITLKTMAIVYNDDTGIFSFYPDMNDDTKVNLKPDSLVLLAGWSPDGEIQVADWSVPANHTDIDSTLGGQEDIFSAFDSELLATYGIAAGTVAQRLADLGIDIDTIFSYPTANLLDDYSGVLFYTTDNPAVFSINGYPAYTPGNWIFSFLTMSLDDPGNLLFCTSDVRAAIKLDP